MDEKKRATIARGLQDRLGFASSTTLQRMIARESITTNVKQRDVDLALEILGVSAEEAAGKTVRKKTKIRRTEVQMSMEKEQIMYADVFYTCGKAFLLAIFEPSHILFLLTIYHRMQTIQPKKLLTA